MKESPWTSKEYLYSKVPKYSVVKGNLDAADERRNQEIQAFNLNFDSSPKQYSTMDQYKNAEFADWYVNDSINKNVDSYYNQDAIRAVDAIAAYEAEHQELIAKELGVDIDKYRQNAGANTGFLADGLDYLNSFFEPEPESNLMDVKAIMYYYLNLVRSTTLGSQELGLGPPLVRLNYGPLYQDVPCIVTKYDIAIDDFAGYDKKTLIPNRVKVNIAMNEVRVGNFTSHNPEAFGPSDDNVATWESVFKFATVDPRTEPRLTSQATVEEFRNQKDNDLKQLRESNLANEES